MLGIRKAAARRIRAFSAAAKVAEAQTPAVASGAALHSLDSQINKIARRNEELEAKLAEMAPSPIPDSPWKNPATYAATRRHLDFALSLVPAAYHDASYQEVEREMIWQKKWFAVEHVQNFQNHGDFRVVDVGAQSYVITMDRHGELHAFHNVCRHRGAKLCTGGGNKKRLNCPYHHWSYNLKGELVGAPHFDQPRFDRSNSGLIPMRVETYAGIVWLCADPSTASVAEQLGGSAGVPELERYPFQNMKIVGSKDYRINCDWKLLAENFMEYYHLYAVHPELAKFSTVEQHKDNQGPGNYVGFVTNPLTNSGGCMDLDQFHPTPGGGALTTSEWDAKDTAFFYHLFPNVSITVYPHSVYTLIMLPQQEPGRTYEKLTFLQHPGSRLETDTDEQYAQKVEAALGFVCNVNQEDVDICEMVGHGVRQGPYEGGVFSPTMEHTVYRYQNMVIDALTGAAPPLYPPVMKDYEAHMAGRSG
mmetsp:Transcript_10184/g.24276  ORF Transcript_10184/g.24276 Transcript_10184/m.24276 type:complete len:476 (-) Transcript_10184:298-1725(-)